MPASIRERLIAAITTAVSGEYGIPAPESERDLPVTIVADGQDDVTDGAYDMHQITMPIAVASAATAASKDRAAMRAQANELLAQIVVAMYTDPTFGSLADGVTYTGGVIQTEIGKFVFAEAQFSVTYHHVRGDPYTIN